MIGLSKKDQLKRHTPLKEKPYKNKEYLQWFHNQGFGCLVCGDTFTEAHHVLSGNRGRPDDSIVPLCVDHHRGRFSPHGADAKEFFEKYPKEMLLETAHKLHSVYMRTS